MYSVLTARSFAQFDLKLDQASACAFSGDGRYLAVALADARTIQFFTAELKVCVRRASCREPHALHHTERPSLADAGAPVPDSKQAHDHLAGFCTQ